MSHLGSVLLLAWMHSSREYRCASCLNVDASSLDDRRLRMMHIQHRVSSLSATLIPASWE